MILGSSLSDIPNQPSPQKEHTATCTINALTTSRPSTKTGNPFYGYTDSLARVSAVTAEVNATLCCVAGRQCRQWTKHLQPLMTHYPTDKEKEKFTAGDALVARHALRQLMFSSIYTISRTSPPVTQHQEFHTAMSCVRSFSGSCEPSQHQSAVPVAILGFVSRLLKLTTFCCLSFGPKCSAFPFAI
jgi:hypothetical protein